MRHEHPLLVAEYLPDPARRVLQGAGCSFVDGAGHRYLHAAPVAEIDDALAEQVVEAALSARQSVSDDGWARYLLDSQATVVPGLAVLRHPIELLEWITVQPSAKQMQIGANAYLYASDPDDILFVLPHHRQPAPDDRPARPTESGGWSLVCCGTLSFVEEAAAVRADTLLVAGRIAVELAASTA